MRSSRWYRTAHAAAVTSLVALMIPLLDTASAQAAKPHGLAFLPLSGPVGSSVTVAGLGFDDASPVTAVRFNGTAAQFSIESNQTITTKVPPGATSGSVSVTDAEGTSRTFLRFTVTTGSGVLSVAGFLPVEGSPGDVIQIFGTGVDDATGVAFDGVPASIVPSNNTLMAVVPDGATSGPVSVVTPSGLASSLNNFTVRRQGANQHRRTVSLAFVGNRAQGRVRAADGFKGCAADVPVKIQRRNGNAWQTVAADRTSSSGRYSRTIGDRHGTFRALAPQVKVNGGKHVCGRRASGSRQI